MWHLVRAFNGTCSSACWCNNGSPEGAIVALSARDYLWAWKADVVDAAFILQSGPRGAGKYLASLRMIESHGWSADRILSESRRMVDLRAQADDHRRHAATFDRMADNVEAGRDLADGLPLSARDPQRRLHNEGP